MGLKEEFTNTMNEYDAAVQEVQKNRKFFDGLLGMGTHPGSAACHDTMDRRVAEICGQAAESADAGEKAELVWAVFQAEGSWKGPEYARLMLAAIQRHTLPLISGLEETDRKELAEWYRKTYPRHKRLPMQEQVLKALKEQNK